MSDVDKQLPKADALMDKIESVVKIGSAYVMCPRSQSTDSRDVPSALRERIKVWKCGGHSTHRGDMFPLELPRQRQRIGP